MAMLNSISSSLSGMKVAQSQLEIISNNITNVDTKGYTRKTASQSANIVAGSTMGVKLGATQRTVDEGLLKSFLASNSLNSSLQSQHDYLSRLDNFMGTPEDGNSVANNVADLQKSVETFATNVSSPASRYSLLSSAKNLTDKLNYLSENIQVLRGNADLEISENAEKINSLLKSIDGLNTDIVKYTILNKDGVTNLKDQRDEALRELSSCLDITYYTRDTGAVVIQTTSGVMLLDNEVHEISHSALARVGSDNSYESGNIQGIFVDDKDITSKLSGGKIGGLIEIRDKQLTSLQTQLDEVSKVLYDQINQIHNQGTAFPNMPSELIGNRTFIADSATGAYSQNIKIENGDVRFIIFDEKGNQHATTTLGGGIGFKQGSINDMMGELQNWLRSENGANLASATVSMDGNSHLVISTGDSNYRLSIIDEATSIPGSEQKDVTISFDSNADGRYDSSDQGFSSFFGFNDFFINNQNNYIYDSKVLSKNAFIGVNAPTTWSFSDSNNGFDYGTINISKGMNIQDVAKQINENPDLNTHLKASLISNGDGYMLRIESLEGAELSISEVAGGGVLEKIGLSVSSSGYSANLDVKSNLKENPGLIVGGSPHFDSNSGTYTISGASNNIANKLSAVFHDTQSFKQAGDMASTSTTIANYTSTFVGNVASLTNTAASSLEYQTALTEAISFKEAQVSGIDLDEELAQMIIYQQSYAACAQVFTASKDILDILLGMV